MRPGDQVWVIPTGRCGTVIGLRPDGRLLVQERAGPRIVVARERVIVLTGPDGYAA